MKRKLNRIMICLVVLALVAGALFQLSRSRNYQVFGTLIARGEAGQNRIALTFDDGPSPGFTRQVLGLLDEASVRATFFVTGREAEARLELLAEMVAQGHVIGNHSYSHQRMVLMTPATIREELARTDAAIRAAGFEGPIHFRPPYGKKLFVLPWVLAQQQRLTVMWSQEPDAAEFTTPEDLANHIVTQARDGDILLMHVMYSSRELERSALPLVISGLRARGFELTTVSELIGVPEAQ